MSDSPFSALPRPVPPAPDDGPKRWKDMNFEQRVNCVLRAICFGKNLVQSLELEYSADPISVVEFLDSAEFVDRYKVLETRFKNAAARVATLAEAAIVLGSAVNSNPVPVKDISKVYHDRANPVEDSDPAHDASVVAQSLEIINRNSWKAERIG